jgi:hypothetical protein
MDQNQQRVLRINEQHILQLGLEFAGAKMTQSDKSNQRKFRDLYGPDPKAAAVCFVDLQTKDIGDARIKRIDPFYFFVALYWLRGYGTETRVSSAFRIACNETGRNHSWKYVAAIQALGQHKVRNTITKGK